MAPQLFTDLTALIRAHPFVAGLSLVFFTPPFFPIVKFFSPLLISTAIFMLALFTMGPKDAANNEAEGGENWEDSSVSERVDGERMTKPRKADGSWTDWAKRIEESSLSWMSPRHKNNNQWKASGLNDGNVSILEETSWVKGADFSPYEHESAVTEAESSSRSIEDTISSRFVPTLMAPSMLFKVDSRLQEAADRMFEDLSEDAPELEDVEESEPVADPAGSSAVPEKVKNLLNHAAKHGVEHQPMEKLEIPKRVLSETSEIDSPDTDLEDSSDLDKSKKFMFANVRKNSVNANSGLSATSGISDVDSPVAEILTLSGNLDHLESLGDFMGDVAHAEKTGQDSPELAALQPTTREQVENVKDELENFVLEDQNEEKSVLTSETKTSSDPDSVPKISSSTSDDAPAIKPSLQSDSSVKLTEQPK